MRSSMFGLTRVTSVSPHEVGFTDTSPVPLLFFALAMSTVIQLTVALKTPTDEITFDLVNMPMWCV